MQKGPFRVHRVQKNVFAKIEKDLIAWICVRLPAWTTPDQLTLIGVIGAAITLAGYALSRLDPLFFWLASFGLFVHWFGDSLDGSLARFRRIERPIYGYFIDHTVDAICNLMIMLGLGLTLQVRMDVALFTLIGYYLLCIYVFITNHLSGVFVLSFFKIGPTELRLMIVVLNTWMFFAGSRGIYIHGVYVSLFDGLVLFIGLSFTSVFLYRVVVGIRTLRHPSRSGAARPATSAVDQSVPIKSSKLVK